jgi:hypothetical protein
MASEGAADISAEYRESSTEQPDTSLAYEQAIVLTDATSEKDAGSDDENASEDTGDSGNVSDNGGHVKIAAEDALAGVSYDFGLLKVTRAHITTLKSSFHFFPKGFAQLPGIEYVPNPKENEVVVFKDFFTVGLRIPPHTVLLDILCKFQVQLHQLMLNAIVPIGKFI